MPQRVGILAPSGRDSNVIFNILAKAGIESIQCGSASELIEAFDCNQVGTFVLAEEALGDAALDQLVERLACQPPWSDLPTVLLTRRGGNPLLQSRLAEALGNTTILERPFFPGTLVSAALTSLRARKRQHEVEQHVAELAAREQELSHERHRLAASEARLRQANDTLGKRFAEALEEKRVLADVVEGTDAFVQVADLDYRWLAINRASADEFERIFAIRPQIGDSMLETLAHVPRHRDAVHEVWARALAGEEFTEIREFGDEDRYRRYYEMKFNTLRNAAGECIGAYQFVYDVTDRIRDQERLAQAQARVHEMAKLETLGQLTGGVAHDFNNLLTPIVGALDVLNHKLEGDDRMGRLVRGALESAERAALLVQRLLSFARRQHLEARPINVGELIVGIRDLVQRSIGPHVNVNVRVVEQLPAAKIDPNQLELAVLNLAVNASDAMSSGGTLTIDVSQRRLRAGEVDSLKAGLHIRLAVSDTGSGMDAATIQRAIEPFFTTKGPGHGTGLGLSMVHGLAAQSGGTLRLLSTPWQGTTAEVWLPACEERADSLTIARAGVPDQPRTAVILLVDDEEVVRRATADMLQELGHHVIEAPAGTGALRMLSERPDIDILVTDYLMPGMRGGELIERARRIKPSLKALIITGYARMAPSKEGVARLAKPFRAADLGREIAAMLMSEAGSC